MINPAFFEENVEVGDVIICLIISEPAGKSPRPDWRRRRALSTLRFALAAAGFVPAVL
jgi:hypothetical protein